MIPRSEAFKARSMSFNEDLSNGVTNKTRASGIVIEAIWLRGVSTRSILNVHGQTKLALATSTDTTKFTSKVIGETESFSL